MPKAESAGILLWRVREGRVEVLLVHPGGPFWARKDLGAWSIPKGEIAPGDDALATAKRELAEETGCALEGETVPLGSVTQKAGKVVHAWAMRGDLDASAIVSNTFEMEWPKGSGGTQSFPEVDRAEWLTLDAARRKINPAQAGLLDRLEAMTKGNET
jgi:predicted NUDIX family NTP pyrophosphohydrolase